MTLTAALTLALTGMTYMSNRSEPVHKPAIRVWVSSAHQPPVKGDCPAVQRAIGFYRRAYTASRTAMGLPSAPPRAWYPCDAARRRAVQWRTRAHKAARELARWKRDNYQWWRWLPANWAALGACETGYGRRPGNWSHDSGQYVSAFGIARVNYALDAHRIGNLSWDETIARLGRLPTPREQLDAALSHYRTYGDGWGCPGP